MAISLDTPRTPSLKLTAVKQYAVGYVLHVAVVPWLEYGTQRVKLAPDGTPRTQEVLTLRIVKSTGTKGDNEPVEPDEEVTVWLSGHKRWAWSEAKKQARGLQVGDKVKITYTRDEPGKSASPKKVWEIEVKRSDATQDADIIAECEARYHQINAERAAAPAASSRVAIADSAEHESQMDADDGIPF